MKLQTFLAFVFFILLTLTARAQSEMEDVVYLKNGGVTRGIILEIIPDSTLKIQTRDRNVFVYNFSEILKVVKENVKVEVKSNETSPNQVTNQKPPIKEKEVFKQSGYHGIFKLGPMGFSSYSVNLINGYQFNPYLLLGLGVGLDNYRGIGTFLSGSENNQRTDLFLPIYLDFRFHVSSSRTTFITYANLGYSQYLMGRENIDPSSSSSSYNSYYYVPTRGGTFFCSGIGIKVFATKTIGIVADFGFKFQTYQAQEYSYKSSYYGSGSTSYQYTGTTTQLSVSPMINLGVAF